MTPKELGCDKICNECIYGGDYHYDKKSKECIAHPQKTKEEIKLLYLKKQKFDLLKKLLTMHEELNAVNKNITLTNLLNKMKNY